MTIENNLQSIADSLKIIADLLTVQTATKAIPNAKTNPTPTAAPAPVQVQAVPAQAASNPAPVVQPVAPDPVQNVMPAAPVFTPVPAPAVSTEAPAFASKQALMDFVMGSYRTMGAEKGAKIQDVLVSLGYANINDVDPSKWGDLKHGIEALMKS
jgi:hypothetical protein